MDVSLTTSSLLVEAERAVALASTDPVRAQELAVSVVARARAAPEAEAVAEWALGFACRELLRSEDALRHMQRSVRVAEKARLHARAAQVRVSLALEHLHAGRTATALAELDRAAAQPGVDDVRLCNQVAVVYMQLGRHDAALAASERAVRAATARRDDALLALALGGRGLAQAWIGDASGAERDLARAETLRRRLGDELAAWYQHHNRGFARLRAGDLPGALRFYDEAEAGLVGLHVPVAVSRIDRADALLRAGLAGEALVVSRAAATELAAGGRESEYAEALVLVARAAADAGDWAEASTSAEQAAIAFARQERGSWEALAHCVAARARLAVAESVEVPAAVLAASAAADLALSAGWTEQALDLRVQAARAAWRAGVPSLARDIAATVASCRRQRSPLLRMSGWHAEALLRIVDGNLTAARHALRQSLNALAVHRSMLGSLDLRVSSARSGTAVAQLLVDLAVPSRSAPAILRAAEEFRAAALHLTAAPAQRPDATLRSQLDLLRATVLDEERALLLDDGSFLEVRARRARLEEEVLRRARHSSGRRNVRRLPTIEQIRRRLGQRVLVSYVGHDGRLLAVVLTPRSSRCIDLGDFDSLQLELRHLRFALRRLAGGDVAASRLVTIGAERLQKRLISPMRLSPDTDLVLVPTRSLHAVPWGLLPELWSRAVEVTPSVALWCRDALEAASNRVAVVAGPRLAGALVEVAAVAACHDDSVVLAGEAATTAATLELLGTVGSAHIACHGTFRADNPAFSTLLLADGPIVGYDLDRLENTPRLVVLSACESGRSGVHAGDEMLGLVATFVDRGARQVVASVVPVDDTATRAVMTSFHRALASGATPAAALQQARALAGSAVERAVAGSFVCFSAESC